MKTVERRIRIVIAAALQDAGEATRALEIARGRQRTFNTLSRN
jgi:hypothetical protein